jgi:hypothetical protein
MKWKNYIQELKISENDIEIKLSKEYIITKNFKIKKPKQAINTKSLKQKKL